MSQWTPHPDRARIVLVDPSVFGQSHLLVNLGMIRLCRRLFDVVDVVAEASHCEALRQYGADRDGGVRLHPYQKRRELYYKIPLDAPSATPLIFLNLEFSLFIYVHIVRREQRRRRIAWALHSHFAYDGDRNLKSRLKRRAKTMLLFRLAGVNFVVYGNRIRNNLCALIGQSINTEQIRAVIHPLGVGPLGSRDGQRDSAVTRLVYLSGWHQLSPRAKSLLTYIQDIAKRSATLELHVVDRSVKSLQGGTPVLTSDYSSRLDCLRDADMVVYLPTNNYTLQASGALMDAFVSGVPLVGLQTDFQLEVEDLVGEVGFFFQQDEDLLEFMRGVGDGANLKDELETRRRNLASGHQSVMLAAEIQLRELLRDAADDSCGESYE